MGRGESSTPIIGETISDKETIEKYRATFPHLNDQPFLKTDLNIGPGMMIDSVEWRKSEKTALKNGFSLLKKELQDLRHHAPGELTNQIQNENTQAILNKVTELENIHKLISYHISNRVASLSDGEQSTNMGTMKSLADWLKTLISKILWIVPMRREIVPTESLLERMNNVLKQTHTFLKRHGGDPGQNRRGLNLQRVIFQTVNYMFQHQLITERQFRNFFQTPKNLKLAASNMVATFVLQYGTQKSYPRFPRPQFILRDSYSSHFWLLFQLLDKRGKIQFSYLSLKFLLIYHHAYYQLRKEYVASLIFKLEDVIHSLGENQHPSVQREEKGKELTEEGLYHPSLKEAIEKVTKYFLKRRNKYEQEESKIICFLFLDFIHEWYPDDVLKSELFMKEPVSQKKFALLSAGLKLMEEMSRIESYVDHKFSEPFEPDEKSPQKHLEDLKLLKKYLEIICKKHNTFLKDSRNPNNRRINQFYTQKEEIKRKQFMVFSSISIAEQDLQDFLNFHKLQKLQHMSPNSRYLPTIMLKKILE